MTGAQRQRVEDLFGELCALDAGERDARLSAVEDEEVRAEVASLLHHTGDGTSSVGNVIGDVMQSAASAGAFGNRTVSPGTRFDRYRIERRLGQGGMGDVYEAHRENDFHKRVALKIVRYGLDSEFARRQFQQERQVLAGLEHPNIARLLDGGEAEGCPYLVLEYVEGTPIDRFCQGRPRDVVLRLFLKVCDAVEYAHRNLVIHRDLKPANILVTEEGDPKLLDFGIAKLLDPGADVTRTGLAALTPQYASPEQILGGSIATTSDVYSLGVILYEILAGRKPYTISSSNPAEMQRLIVETDPPRPGVSEDLDNILLMALRKDPARRYRSVRELAEDIGRSLEHRPVAARPDTIGYRTGRFVRRHWTGVLAGAALITAIAAGMTATVYQSRLARQRFEQVRKLAHSFVFDYHDELAKVEGNTAVREKMVRTALQYLDNLAQAAGGDLDLQKELAAAYQKVGDVQGSTSLPSLGHTDQAVASYRKAEAIHDRIELRDPLHRRGLDQFYLNFAQLLRLTRDYTGAARMSELARANLEQMARERPDDDQIQINLASAWCLLGDLDEDVGRAASAFVKDSKCVAIARGVLARSQTINTLRMTQGALQRIGTTARTTGRLEESRAALDEAEKLLGRMLELEPDNPSFHRASGLLAQFQSNLWYDDLGPSLGDPARSLVYSRQYLEAARRTALRDPNNAVARFSLAVALFRLSFPLKHSDPAGAVASARESVRIFDELIGGGRGSYLFVSRRARALRRLSEALLFAGKAPEARTAAAAALAVQREMAARDPKDLQEAALLVMTLVASAEAAGDAAGAAGYLTEANQAAEAIYARNRNELTSAIPVSRVRAALGEHWKKAGDFEQSQRWFKEAQIVWTEFPDQMEFVRRMSASLKMSR